MLQYNTPDIMAGLKYRYVPTESFYESDMADVKYLDLSNVATTKGPCASLLWTARVHALLHLASASYMFADCIWKQYRVSVLHA